MDRPETIELVGQALRWRTEVPFYTHYKSDDGRAFVALSIYGDVDWEIEVIKGSVTLRGHADDLGEASEDARAALAEVADAVAAWLPEREARIHADAAKMAMELAAQRNALSEAIDTVCGLDHELKSTGGAVPSNALDALRGWEARVRAEERERCAAVIQEARYRLANCDGSCRKARRAA